jgi:hypothetical protein
MAWMRAGSIGNSHLTGIVPVFSLFLKSGRDLSVYVNIYGSYALQGKLNPEISDINRQGNFSKKQADACKPGDKLCPRIHKRKVSSRHKTGV